MAGGSEMSELSELSETNTVRPPDTVCIKLSTL